MTLRCLIVDDNREFLEIARVVLERDGVNVVGIASTSAEALRQVAELQPDVTLVDVMLGNESGFDLAHRIAMAREGNFSRVILISTYAEQDLADLIPARPTIEFLPKGDLSGRAIRSVVESPTDDAGA
jgi:CheY-like chemotaxis protein